MFLSQGVFEKDKAGDIFAECKGKEQGLRA